MSNFIEPRKLCSHKITWLYGLHVMANVMTISRAWCKTIITTSFYIRSYNSFAPSPRFARTGYRERKCNSAYLHQTQQGDLLSHKDLTGSQVRLQANKHNTCKINSACTIHIVDQTPSFINIWWGKRFTLVIVEITYIVTQQIF